MCFDGRGFEEGINKSPEPGASEQLGWAGKKEMPLSTGTTAGGNAHLSLSCVSLETASVVFFCSFKMRIL